MALTDTTLKALKPRDKAYTITDDEGCTWKRFRPGCRLALPLPAERQVRETDAGQVPGAHAEECPPDAGRAARKMAIGESPAKKK
jgi:hypothetical protein